MDWNSVEDAEFRILLRDYFAEHVPEHLRNHPHRIPRWAVSRDWFMALSRKGWLAPSWPRRYGGMELDPAKTLIYFSEIERAGIPRIYDMAIFMLGPLIIKHGTEEQKQTYLPRILSGEHLWSQGYSEPEAGSDLAGLRTTAVRDGDAYVVNGHKIWTTFLDDATHMFLLARTSNEARKQDGISVLLVDLKAPGTTRRLIRTLAGQEELGEVIFENVRIPVSDRIGPEGKGWTLAKDLLEFERLNNGSPKLPLSVLRLFSDFAEKHRLLDDPWTQQRFAQLRMDLEDQMTAYRYFCDRWKSGLGIGPEVSMLKIWSTETFQRTADLFLDLTGEAGVQATNSDDDPTGALRMYFNSRPATIYAGCNEVQRDILSKRVLGLAESK